METQDNSFMSLHKKLDKLIELLSADKQSAPRPEPKRELWEVAKDTWMKHPDESFASDAWKAVASSCKSWFIEILEGEREKIGCEIIKYSHSKEISSVETADAIIQLLKKKL